MSGVAIAIFWVSVGLLALAVVLPMWHSRIPRRHFGSMAPSEEDVARGLYKTEVTVMQCYADLDTVRETLRINANGAAAFQNTAEGLESMEETSRGFIYVKKTLDRALKARDRARGWAFLNGFGTAVEKHIKNPAAAAEEMDALSAKPRSGFIKN